MKAFVITVFQSPQSLEGVKRLRDSSERMGHRLDVCLWGATTPKDVEGVMKANSVQWTYPWEAQTVCPHTQLLLHPYKTANRDARMACFMSHYRLWKLCAEFDEPILILEDDSIFIKPFDENVLANSYGMVGVNDPRGATRRSGVYHRRVQDQDEPVCPVPWVDEINVPQGLAGASAYAVKPWAAREAIDLTHRLGAWPNDALLCKQNVDWLGVSREYYTTVTKRPSSLA